MKRERKRRVVRSLHCVTRVRRGIAKSLYKYVEMLLRGVTSYSTADGKIVKVERIKEDNDPWGLDLIHLTMLGDTADSTRACQLTCTHAQTHTMGLCSLPPRKQLEKPSKTGKSSPCFFFLTFRCTEHTQQGERAKEKNTKRTQQRCGWCHHTHLPATTRRETSLMCTHTHTQTLW